MADDSEGDGEIVAEATAAEDEEQPREIHLVEEENGYWTLVDTERGAIGDAPSKAAGLHLMEQVLEEMDGVEIPDVEPEEPSERPDRDPKLPPEPSMPDRDDA
ncbi:hypothetical protein [Halolamina rubra]|uniref:hypothetical protein n=1 Tax=Halolamina rubra TaxID=1380430 RepID=UPI000678A0C6|nr:hypothetical protein [Halolamina rubra]